MRAVATPMPVSVTMKVYFRPTLSPSQPNTNAPSGNVEVEGTDEGTTVEMTFALAGS